MEITISVKRQHSASEKAYIQTFHYSGNGKLTVADWLTEVNQAEASNDPIAWECSCREKKAEPVQWSSMDGRCCPAAVSWRMSGKRGR